MAAVKSFGAMVFAGLIIVYTVFGGWFFGVKSIPLPLVWQALFIAFIAAALHYLAFCEHLIHTASFGHRLVLFGLPLLLVVCAFAYFGGWFPVQELVNWLAFIGLYVLFFGIVTAVMKLYFRFTGMKYAEVLSVYQQNH